MSCLVDITVLLAAAEPATRGHAACYALLEDLRRRIGPWYVTSQIIKELYRYGTDRGILGMPWSISAIDSFVEGLRRSRGLRLLRETDCHVRADIQVRKELPSGSGELALHREVATLMYEHGVRRIYTTDSGYFYFPFLEVLSPFR